MAATETTKAPLFGRAFVYMVEIEGIETELYPYGFLVEPVGSNRRWRLSSRVPLVQLGRCRRRRLYSVISQNNRRISLSPRSFGWTQSL